MEKKSVVKKKKTNWGGQNPAQRSIDQKTTTEGWKRRKRKKYFGADGKY